MVSKTVKFLPVGGSLNHSQFTSVYFYNVNPFSPKNLHFDALRVFSIEKYGDVWIPTIGLDVKLD